MKLAAGVQVEEPAHLGEGLGERAAGLLSSLLPACRERGEWDTAIEILNQTKDERAVGFLIDTLTRGVPMSVPEEKGKVVRAVVREIEKVPDPTARSDAAASARPITAPPPPRPSRSSGSTTLPTTSTPRTPCPIFPRG